MKDSELDLLVAGHEVFDRVICDFGEETRTLGGIHNLENGFKILAPKIKRKYLPIMRGEAIILIDKNESSKLVKANINKIDLFCGKNLPRQGNKSKWTHIAYVNKLNEVTYPNNSIVSVDLCKGPLILHPQKKRPNYIFMSSDEFDSEIVSQTSPTSVVISHGPFGAEIIQNGLTAHRIYGEPMSNCNILGAGDFFAAAFIVSKLKNNTDKKALSFADLETRKWLLSR